MLSVAVPLDMALWTLGEVTIQLLLWCPHFPLANIYEYPDMADLHQCFTMFAHVHLIQSSSNNVILRVLGPIVLIAFLPTIS